MSDRSRFMAHALGGSATMSVAGLQLCDRSKFTLIATTSTQEGGFGNLEYIGSSAKKCNTLQPVSCVLNNLRRYRASRAHEWN